MKIIIFSLILILLPVSETFAYVFSVDNNGTIIRWNRNIKTISYHIHSKNNLGLSELVINSIAAASLSEWNNNTSINLELHNGDGQTSNSQNDIFFSDNSLFFPGNGIVGLTLIAYRENSGDIVETDIILNEKFSLSTLNSREFYLGNILTHEIGHSLGLAHSEVQYSSMFFKLTNGQETLSGDDIAAAQVRYPASDNLGVIKGRVVGKDIGTGIFGNHLQAISIATGKVMSSAVSDERGDFSIGGLDLTDEYFIYNSPLALKDHLPSYYLSANKNFCLNNRAYVGSFYQTCLNRDEGYPKTVNFKDTIVRDIQNISIRCSLESPPRYLLAKGEGAFELDMGMVQSEVGNSFVGFFTLSEIIQQTKDNVKIDLSSLDVPIKNIGEEYFLDINIVTQPLYSQLKTVTSVKFTDYSTSEFPTSVEVDSDGNPVLDYTVRLSLKSGFSNDNIFDINISPYAFSDVKLSGIDRDGNGQDDIIEGFVNTTTFEVDDFFPEFDVFNEKRYFYLFSSRIIKKDSLGHYSKYSSRKYSDMDNSFCVDAPNSVVLNSLVVEDTSEESPSRGDDQLSPFACGSIDISKGGGGNGGSALFTLLFGVLLMLNMLPRKQF